MLISPARAERPRDVVGPPLATGCPFCEGNEAITPPETYALRPGGGGPNTPGWRVRVVPNKYPAVEQSEGVHEVIINSTRHVSSLADLSPEDVETAVDAWALRLEAIAGDPRGLTPFLFLNQGDRAGASLRHTHAQLVGLPFTSPRLHAKDLAFARSNEALLVADRHPSRLIAEFRGLVAWCPAIPPLPGTIRLAPAEPEPDWRVGVDSAALAEALIQLVGMIEGRLGAEDINVMLYERPPGGTARYHWHIDLVPRLGTLAGLELGAGVMAASRTSEDVAASLRASG